MLARNKKRQIAKITVFITSIFVIFMSVTYSFITQALTGEKQVVINAGVLDLVLEEENAITISNALPMSDEVGMIQEDVFKFRLVNKTSNPTKYILKLREINTGTLAKTDVKYGLIKNGEAKIDLLSNLDNLVIDMGIITDNEIINYELRLWIDSTVTQIEQIEGKFLSLKMVAEVNQKIQGPTGNVNDIVFDETLIGDNCKLYDDGVDTFLVGKCSNNYVWYSGKLWRVVLENNETGAVKMVTDNAITTIPYNEADNTSFENSYVDQWLTQEFLPTLHDSGSYLVEDSQWYDIMDSSDSPTRPVGETSITRTVGLLNSYEYYTTYASSDGLATPLTGYLNKDIFWWLITPYSNSSVNRVLDSGTPSYIGSEVGHGVRPSVVMQSKIKISNGTGKKDDPYILEGDIQEIVNGITMLSTRYSGEYITFNNELYRIVGVEEGLIKITSVNIPNSLSAIKFHNAITSGVSTFANADIKNDLETYYKKLEYSNIKAYNMIEPNREWYLGSIGNGNYKNTICATADLNISMNDCVVKKPSTTTSIGLPRVGEIFTSQIARKRMSFWTLTPHSITYGRNIFSNNNLNYGTINKADGVRPSMYLKQNVVIASHNTGNGTYEYPYSIELGA